jgi:transposase
MTVEVGMGLKRRQFSREFKMILIREIELGKPLSRVARENEISPNVLLRWKQEFRTYGDESFGGNGRMYKNEAVIAELERKIGQLTLENDLLKKVLTQFQRQDPARKKTGSSRR